MGERMAGKSKICFRGFKFQPSRWFGVCLESSLIEIFRRNETKSFDCSIFDIWMRDFLKLVHIDFLFKSKWRWRRDNACKVKTNQSLFHIYAKDVFWLIIIRPKRSSKNGFAGAVLFWTALKNRPSHRLFLTCFLFFEIIFHNLNSFACPTAFEAPAPSRSQSWEVGFGRVPLRDRTRFSTAHSKRLSKKYIIRKRIRHSWLGWHLILFIWI